MNTRKVEVKLDGYQLRKFTEALGGVTKELRNINAKLEVLGEEAKRMNELLEEPEDGAA